jgi:hypothetical protein
MQTVHVLLSSTLPVLVASCLNSFISAFNMLREVAVPASSNNENFHKILQTTV